jgi:hypothetical protein
MKQLIEISQISPLDISFPLIKKHTSYPRFRSWTFLSCFGELEMMGPISNLPKQPFDFSPICSFDLLVKLSLKMKSY